MAYKSYKEPPQKYSERGGSYGQKDATYKSIKSYYGQQPAERKYVNLEEKQRIQKSEEQKVSAVVPSISELIDKAEKLIPIKSEKENSFEKILREIEQGSSKEKAHSEIPGEEIKPKKQEKKEEQIITHYAPEQKPRQKLPSLPTIRQTPRPQLEQKRDFLIDPSNLFKTISENRNLLIFLGMGIILMAMWAEMNKNTITTGSVIEEKLAQINNNTKSLSCPAIPACPNCPKIECNNVDYGRLSCEGVNFDKIYFENLCKTFNTTVFVGYWNGSAQIAGFAAKEGNDTYIFQNITIKIN